jgi:hypothetical protein
MMSTVQSRLPELIPKLMKRTNYGAVVAVVVAAAVS